MPTLYRTTDGAVLEHDGRFGLLRGANWNGLLNRDDLTGHLERLAGRVPVVGGAALLAGSLLPPIDRQEVWAAGVTYFRSRTARMEESKGAGGGDFYDRVYTADRPELFFKSSRHRVAGHGQTVRIRRDSRWNVPEPELTLVVTATGRIIGYTIGNDMSSRDIEGENPLYLPQAKVYDRSCGLGPGILVTDAPLPPTTAIQLEVARNGTAAFTGETTLAAMKRTPDELVSWLFRENSFPDGCFLMTGTGIVPPDDFSLQPGDMVRITIEPIGTLTNEVV